VAYSYPILLDLTGKLVVIIGGGRSAAGKARGALEAGARVRCIAPEFHQKIPYEVERITARFQPSQLDGADLVFAATDSPEVNFDVVREARVRKILVSRTDGEDENHRDFVLPAVYRNDPIVISVSTGSPLLSKTLRDEIPKQIVRMEQYKQMAELMRTLRPWLLKSSLPVARRALAMMDLASVPALDALAQGGGEGLYRWLVERYPELKLEKAP
jgi:siroheme synthase-like protein